MTERAVKLHGRVTLTARIELLTGLHIGGNAGGLEIGGLDKPVVRNPLTNEPYIPGSSLKGKLRSLMEKAYAAPQNYPVNRQAGVFVHIAATAKQYDELPVSSIFGTFPENNGFVTPTPTRLVVRDVPLTEDSARRLRTLKTDLPFTEVKWEAAIDRVTSAASPRQIERVPAGAIFGPAELIFSVYSRPEQPASDVAALFVRVVEALEYLEDDYLGGMGTRGNGRVALHLESLSARRISSAGYEPPVVFALGTQPRVQTLDRDLLRQWLVDTFAPPVG